MPTNGGSLRVDSHRGYGAVRPVESRVAALLDAERDAGITAENYYGGLQPRAEQAKNDLLAFLIEARRMGKKVGAYGAAAKGNTLLNFAGVRPDLLPWVADRNPAKQGKYLPGSRIPIQTEDAIRTERPDYVLVLPWNLKQEVIAQTDYIREWGGQYVIAVPFLNLC